MWHPPFPNATCLCMRLSVPLSVWVAVEEAGRYIGGKYACSLARTLAQFFVAMGDFFQGQEGRGREEAGRKNGAPLPP